MAYLSPPECRGEANGVAGAPQGLPQAQRGTARNPTHYAAVMKGARVTRQARRKDTVRMRTQSLDRLDANGRSAYRQPIPAAELDRQRDLELISRGERRRRREQGPSSPPRAPPEVGGMRDGGEDGQGASPARRGWRGRLAAREREQDMGREQREEQEEWKRGLYRNELQAIKLQIERNSVDTEGVSSSPVSVCIRVTSRSRESLSSLTPNIERACR